MYFIQTPFESIQKIGIGDKLYVSLGVLNAFDANEPLNVIHFEW